MLPAFPLNIILQDCCCKQTDISPKHRHKRLKFRFYAVGGDFPDTLIYLAEIAVIFAILIQSIVTVTISVVTVTFRSTKKKYLPSLWVFGSMKGFAIITGSAGSITFIGTGTNILLSLPSLFYRSVFRNFERTSEQDEAFPMVKGITEKRRIEQSPNKSNWANNHRTSKLAWLKASQTLFACSADF